jgi:hypothetical protein
MGFNDYFLNQQEVRHELAHIRAMRSAGLGNRRQIKASQTRIQALSEAGRSILTTAITEFLTSVDSADKNKYKNYASQVAAAYKMYNATADFGGDMLGGCVDMRVAMIAGEGVSLSSENEATQVYLDKFAEKNQLQGSRLLRMIEMGELEGKTLLQLSPTDKDKAYVKMRALSWQSLKYKVETKPEDPEEPTSITYTKDGKPQSINIKSAVYVRLGGCATDVNDTPNRHHRILTDYENMSRAKYDLNKNTRLFGKVIPTWKTVDDKESRSIKKEMESDDFDIGHGFVGAAEMGLLEPTGNAANAIEKMFVLYLKIVSAGTGIPVQWLAWPELLSNRSTAENMVEAMNAATKKERLVWEEKLHEAIEKGMDIAIDAGFETNAIKDDFTVTLPFVSIEMLKLILEVYMPMEEAKLFSKKTLRDITPLGLNWRAEDKQIAREQKEAMKNSPLNNKVVQDELAAARAGIKPGAGQPGKEQPGDGLPGGMDDE